MGAWQMKASIAAKFSLTPNVPSLDVDAAMSYRRSISIRNTFIDIRPLRFEVESERQVRSWPNSPRHRPMLALFDSDEEASVEMMAELTGGEESCGELCGAPFAIEGVPKKRKKKSKAL